MVKYQQKVVEVMTISMMNAETQTSMLLATCSVIHTVILAIFILEMKAGAVTTTLMSSFLIRCAALAAVEKISQTMVKTVMASQALNITVSSPQKVGKGLFSYITYR